ncbi:MAG: VanZ family protein, partial [Bacteroidia bacterium]
SIFFVLILLTVRGFLMQSRFLELQRSAKIIAFFMCVSYGGSLEIMQGTVCVDRTADIYDFIANSFGCTIGLLFYSRIEKLVLVKFIK